MKRREATESFGKVLKNLRKSKMKTLRELGDAIGFSLSYISDIEHDRKKPPNLNTVSKIENFLGIKDGYLMTLARKIRETSIPTLTQRLRSNPRLSDVLLRADELPEDKKDKVMSQFLDTLNKAEKEN